MFQRPALLTAIPLLAAALTKLVLLEESKRLKGLKPARPAETNPILSAVVVMQQDRHLQAPLAFMETSIQFRTPAF